MKRILIILGIIVLVFIGALVLLPLLFKDSLREKTKTAINNNVNAVVEFTDFKISLLRNFPKISLELTDVYVTGQGEFKSDTLLAILSVRTKTALRQLFAKEGIGIEEIILERPWLNLITAKSGNVNWDIVPEEEAGTESTESSLEMNLDKIKIIDGGFSYNDKEIEMILELTGLNLDLSGEMYGTSAQLLAEGKADRFNLNYEGINYISNVPVSTRTLLNVDYEKIDIAIQENELMINRLPLEVTGLIQMPSDTMLFDLNLKSKESGFDNFLALIPPDYEKYLEGLETSGNASVAGSVKGYYYEEEYPAFNLKIDVSDGNLHYTDLPEEIKNITADITVLKPQGILDSTKVDIQRAHASIKNSPVDLTLKLRNLVSDPYFDGSFVGNLNFNHLKDALPLDSVSMTGNIDADLAFRGRFSSIENEDYTNIMADGRVSISDFMYESASLTRQIEVPVGKLDFSPKAITLSGLRLNIGQSNFNLTGQLTNYLNYIFKEGILSGNMQLNSSLINMNELIRLQVGTGTEQSSEEAMAFDVPGNVNFTFNSDIRQVIFDRLPISDVKGLITARDEKLVLNNLSMQTLGGVVSMTGSYQNTAENQPLFDFGFNVKSVEIPKAIQVFSGLQQIMPIARQSSGNLSSDIKLKGQLTPDFSLISNTVNGGGKILTENVRIVDSPLFGQLKGLLNAERLKNITVDDFSAEIEITDGAIHLNPFKTAIANQEVTIAGDLNTQNLLNMRLDFILERNAFGTDVQNILSALPGQERIQTIPASVLLTGPVGKPEVNIDMKEAQNQIIEEVKKSSKEEIQKSINKLGDGLKKIFK